MEQPIRVMVAEDLPLLREVSSGFAIILCAVAASALGAWFFPVKEVEEE